MTDPHSPRKDDHLVEPLYAGLDVKAGPQPGMSRTRGLFWAALILVMALLISFLS